MIKTYVTEASNHGNRHSHRSATLAAWTKDNPVIGDGEIVIEVVPDPDPDKIKTGDGVTRYLDLPYNGTVGPMGPVGPTGPTGAPGTNGTNGATGATGPGVAVGGTTGQFLWKLSNTDYDTGWRTLVKGDVGLGNVDNTSDINKPVSTAQATAIALKADDSGVVHTTGTESVGGTKTFTLSPAVPTAAARDGTTKAASTLYVDKAISALTVNSVSAAYTLALADAGAVVYHPPSDTTARTWTIPANASVAFPIGSVITIDNDIGAGALTIAITSDTLVLVGAGSTGSRTLAAGGQATAVKVTATRWRISGVGLT